MLLICIPDDHFPERTYILETLFVEFLGIPILIEPSEKSNQTSIQLAFDKSLIIEDHFFCRFKETSYLYQAHIPDSIVSYSCDYVPFLIEADLPVIFGRSVFQVSESSITCGADIFASAFFMLTRWEETVNPVRDRHNRFPFSASLANRFSFHHRPIVNEYVEFLWNMLCYLGYKEQRKVRKFEAIITHDVDIPLQWYNPFTLVKKLGGDLVRRHSLKLALQSTKSYINTLTGKTKDPFDNFDYLMEVSEAHNLQSQFYFLVGGHTPFDKGHLPPSHPFIQSLFQKINDRGHVIGFHPSYTTLEKAKLMATEKKALEKVTEFPVLCGRQHFLRFKVPVTWQTWENEGMEWDSTIYYPEQAGFRCGTCQPFSVFNILTRKKLKLMEVPLTAMEVTWQKYSKVPPEKMLEELMALLETVKKYNGTFVLLWHNSSFNTMEWLPFSHIYEKVLEKIKVLRLN